MRDYKVVLLEQHRQFLIDREPVTADEPFCYYFPQADFVSNALSRENQESLLERARALGNKTP